MRFSMWLAVGASALALAACGRDGRNDLPAIDPSVSFVRTAPGTGQGAWANSTAAFPDDSTVTVGSFDASATFGAGEAGETTLAATGAYDGFVARYDDAGHLLWARSVAGGSEIAMEEVAVLPGGTVVAAGWFYPTVTFAAGQPNETTFTAVETYDGFVASWDGAGNFLWARHVGGPGGGVQGLRVAPTSDGGVALAALAWCSSLTLGTGELNETTLTFSGLEGVVAKYGADGALAWARGTASTGLNSFWGVAGLPGGGVAALGRYQGTTSVGQDGLGADVLLDSLSGSADACLVGYDATGVVLFARTLGGAQDDVPLDLATGAGGALVATGSYYEDFLAGSETAAPESLLSPGNPESLFVACYGPDGAFRWLRGVEGLPSTSRGMRAAVFADGGVGVAGSYGGTIVLGQDDPTMAALTATGERDGFVARWAPDGVLDWATTVPDTLTGEASGIAPLSDGSVVVSGYYGGDCTFGAGGAHETPISTTTAWEFFLARFEADGSF